MSARTKQGCLGVMTTRESLLRKAASSRIEAQGQGLEQGPLPAGIRIRRARTGVAIVHRRSASGRGNPCPLDTRHLDTRTGFIQPTIGYRTGRTQYNLAMRGRARSARHQEGKDQLGTPEAGWRTATTSRKVGSPACPAAPPNVTIRPANPTQSGRRRARPCRRVVLLGNTHLRRQPQRAHTHGVDRGKTPGATNTVSMTGS